MIKKSIERLKQYLFRIKTRRFEKIIGCPLVFKKGTVVEKKILSSDTPVKIGVVGVGYLGQHHARIYKETPGCNLVGVYDVNKEQKEKIAKLYNCRAFESIEELAKNCQAVSVVVPTDKHCSVALELMQHGCDLLIEKPLCSTLEEAERILTMANIKKCIVQVGHIENYNPVMCYLEENLKNPLYISADRLAPFNERGTEVGVVLDLMIHDIGVILNLVKSPVKSIEGVGVNVLSSTEDIANARITFENGCVANINSSRVSLKKIREIRIFEPFAYFSLNFMEQKGYILRKNGKVLEREDIPIEKQEPLKIELQAFIHCVRNAHAPKVGGEFARTALDVAIQIRKDIFKRNKAMTVLVSP